MSNAAKRASSSAALSPAQTKRAATLSSFSALQKRAPILLKHGRRGRAHKSEIRLHEGALHWNWAEWKSKESALPSPKSIPIGAITAVLSGRKTEELLRSAKASEEDACFALISPGKSLSLQVLSGSVEERDLWVAGMVTMIDVMRTEEAYWQQENAK